MNPVSAPSVSVIVPCGTAGRYLDEAVESVLLQTFQDFEIVIVADGSTDPETRRVLAGYRRPKTRVISTLHHGVAAAKNAAIEDAAGYISSLEAADKLAPTFLERATGVLGSNPHVAFVSGWLQTFGEEERTWKHDRCDLTALLAECTVAGPALVRKSAVLAVGGFDEHMPAPGDEQWDLWIRVVKAGFSGVSIPEVLFYRRCQADSIGPSCGRHASPVPLLRYLVDKHQEAYRAHAFDVLLMKEEQSCDLLKATYALDRQVSGWLEPMVQRRRQELNRLLAKVDTIRRQVEDQKRLQHLDAALNAQREQLNGVTRSMIDAEQELSKLRASLSWQLTAPLRYAKDTAARWLRSARRGASGR